MRLTTKLINWLYRALRKEPDSVLSLRIRSATSLTWQIEDGYLTVTTSSGTRSFDLSAYTILALASALTSAGIGITVEYIGSESGLSALALLDGSGDQSQSNGDHLYRFDSLLWAYMDPVASELSRAKVEIGNAIDQMSIPTADDIWLDEWGGYFGVPRESGEADAAYGQRLIVEVMRPRENNKAIEKAIFEAFGQAGTVTDVVENAVRYLPHDGGFTHDSARTYGTLSTQVYGLFDVEYDYNLLGGSTLPVYATKLRAFVERFRAAGTHLRGLTLRNSTAFADSASVSAADAMVFLVSYVLIYNSAKTHNGTLTYAGDSVASESL